MWLGKSSGGRSKVRRFSERASRQRRGWCARGWTLGFEPLEERTLLGLITLEQITNTVGGDNRRPSIDADATHIAFESSNDLLSTNGDQNYEIFLLDRTTTTLTQITDTVGGDNEGPSIDADGTHIAFYSTNDPLGTNADEAYEIFLFETSTSTLTQITNATASSLSPSIDADGSRVAYTSDSDPLGTNADGWFEVFLLETNNGTLRQITDSAYANDINPSIDAEGTRIAFVSRDNWLGENVDNSLEVFLFDTTTSSLTQITDSETWASENWSPSVDADASHIAFESTDDPLGTNADGNYEIFLFETSTSTLTQITNSVGQDNRWPSIDADGTQIAFASRRDPLGTNADGNQEVFLATIWPDADEFESNGSLSEAAVLGSLAKITLRDLTIDGPDDVDYFQVTAQDSGKLIFNALFEHGPVNIDIRVLDGHGNVLGESISTTDDEQITIPVVSQQRYFLEVSGAGAGTNVYALEIENFAAPIPDFIDLPAKDRNHGLNDTGVSQSDDVTNRTEPEIIIEADLHDFAEEGITILTSDQAEGLAADPATPVGGKTSGAAVEVFVNGNSVGFADPIANTGDTLFRFTFEAGQLPKQVFADDDGGWLHYVKGAVRIFDGQMDDQGASDPASGRTQLSPPLLLTIDTVAPPVTILGIDPASSDTGVSGVPGTVADRVTSDTATGFFGEAEGGAVVRMWADANPLSDGVIDASDVYQGLAVALPSHGDHAYTDGGEWRLVGRYDLNDPSENFPLDGLRQIGVTAEDVAGNVSDAVFFNVFLDTQGPRIADLEFNEQGDPHDVFDPKPSQDGPTPLVHSLAISVLDMPGRDDSDPNFLYEALWEDVAEEPGHYLVVGDANGVIPILEVISASDAVVSDQPATGVIVLVFWQPGPDGMFHTDDDLGAPLPDDRFTLTISDSLLDPAGNALDGENNAIEPQAPPQFPSGDGQPGGDFVARFTVDSRPEIGVWAAGTAYLDTNGNFLFDPQNADYTNRDIAYILGFSTDVVTAGNVAAAGAADGFDKLIVYGRTNGNYRWLVDFDNDGVTETLFDEPPWFKNTGMPVTGNFDKNAANGDEVGVFTGSVWRFDEDHDFQLSNDTAITSQLAGFPVVGDFDGDGDEDAATWDVNGNQFFLSLSSLGGGVDQAIATGQVKQTDSFRLASGYAFIGARERPVAADLDGDGIDDLGLWVADRSGMTPGEGAEWYFLVSGGRSIVTRLDPDPLNPTGSVVQFKPTPFGHDLFARFGDEFGVPLVGNFDPPVVAGWQQPVSGESDKPVSGDAQQPEETTAGDAAEDPGTVDVPQGEAEPAPRLGDLVGTSGDDVFVVIPGPTPGSWVVELNGVAREYEGDPVTIEFDGLEGHDTVTVTGTGEDEVAELWPDQLVVTGESLSLTAENVESITVDGGGGNDTASLHDSPGDDWFRATPEWGKLHGDRFFLTALGFPNVTAYATQGGTDVAWLFDSPGDETFEATPEDGRLYGEGFDNRAEGFEYTHGYGHNGGNDTALLYDSEGDDWFKAIPQWAKLYGDGFYTRAVAFPTVCARATGGGIDVAWLFDSPGDDVFKATAEYGRLSGSGFDNRAEAFEYTHGYADKGGNDTARLYDSEGDDRLLATPDLAKLYGNGFYTRAVGFPTVQAYATRGGMDVAELIDSTGADVFHASPQSARLQGATFDNLAVSFHTVSAQSDADDDEDRGYLFDSALDDHLEAADDWARLSNDHPELGFLIAVEGLEQVEASSSGQNDTKDVDAAVDWLILLGWP